MREFAVRTLFVRAACAGVLGLVSPTASFAADTGHVCVRDFAAGLTCSANDVWISAIKPLSITEDCPSGDPATAQAVFDVTLSGGGSSRYDIGFFLALDGGSALSGGNCLHDYLQPPLSSSPVYGDVDGNGRSDLYNGPWWNGEPFDPADSCGDIEAAKDSIKTLISIRFACADSDADGFVDFSTCTSWSSGTASHCQSLGDAFPSGNSRCGCNVVKTGVPMPGTVVPSGRIAGLTLARSGGSDLQLSWSGSCSVTDTDYGVYEGALGQFSSHQSVVCTTGGATSVTIQPAAGNRYYLVVPRNALREGSYGTNSSGTERPPASGACAPQLIQSPCL